MMRNIGRVGLLATVSVLAACGGNSGPTSFSTGSSGGSSTGTSSSGASSSGASSTSSGSTTVTYSMGNGTGSSFQKGAIGISGLTSGALSAGGVAGLDVTVVDQTGALYSGTAVTITLSSTCIAQGLATIAPTAPTIAGSSANTVSTTTGTAALTYTAHGCSGPDAITATAAVNGQTLTATGSINVAAAAIGSIQFTNALPASIGLKGTGLGETSTVTFTVLDSTGNPRPNAPVSFTLSTSVGGITLQPATATSAADGTVQTVVSAGTQHTSVRVTASIASPALSTQSALLSVTTGLPASGAFGISVGAPQYLAGSATVTQACPNVEAFGTDGVVVPITARLADRYNNPAPNGTAVAFTTAGGHIVGACQTPSVPGGAQDGTCKVDWTSANPRPSTSGSPPSLRNGRSVILATSIGEESFTDQNGNGYWDTGEPFVNLGEPYRDDNEDNAYESGEYFLDFNQNGTRDAGDGTFKGIACSGGSCSTTTLAIGAQNLIIMSTAHAVITPTGTGGSFTGTPQSVLHLPVSISGGATYTGTLQFNIIDDNGNPMAAGTIVTVSADSGVGLTAGPAPGGPFTIGCRTNTTGEPLQASLTSLTTTGSGSLYVTVESPGTKTDTVLAIPVSVP